MNGPVIILGGGLWGGLLAYFLIKRRPDVEFILYEKNNSLGGNHTWSFHDKDISREALELLRPMFERSWNRYEVRFPQYSKIIEDSYHCISSTRFHSTLLKEVPSERLKLSEGPAPENVIGDGSFIIDARGQSLIKSSGHQNFVGLEIEVNEPHHLKHPVLMDATVPQLDGFRFIYTLPFDNKRLLIEDTRYSDSNKFSVEELKKNILKYCEDNNWKIKKILREEIGSLPLPLIPPVVSEQHQTINLAGIFHDTTGYSLPDAIRVIESFLVTDFSYDALQKQLSRYREERSSQRYFFRLLNRFLFKASHPEDRYKMLQHFYRLPDSLISDFYAGNFGLYHKLRLFSGRPPVSIKRALLEIIK